MKGDYDHIKSKFPNKIPIKIICKDFKISKTKFLIDENECFSFLFFQIRKYIETNSKESIIFLVENQIVTPSQNIGEFHSKICLSKEDKFLYIVLNKQQTFG